MTPSKHQTLTKIAWSIVSDYPTYEDKEELFSAAYLSGAEYEGDNLYGHMRSAVRYYVLTEPSPVSLPYNSRTVSVVNKSKSGGNPQGHTERAIVAALSGCDSLEEFTLVETRTAEDFLEQKEREEVLTYLMEYGIHYLPARQRDAIKCLYFGELEVYDYCVMYDCTRNALYKAADRGVGMLERMTVSYKQQTGL